MFAWYPFAVPRLRPRALKSPTLLEPIPREKMQNDGGIFPEPSALSSTSQPNPLLRRPNPAHLKNFCDTDIQESKLSRSSRRNGPPPVSGGRKLTARFPHSTLGRNELALLETGQKRLEDLRKGKFVREYVRHQEDKRERERRQFKAQERKKAARRKRVAKAHAIASTEKRRQHQVNEGE